MRTYVIATSAFGKSVTNYFQSLAKHLDKQGHKVIVVFDNHYTLKEKETSIIYKTWPSKRPTKWRDFIFLRALVKEFKPDAMIGQFGSTNMTLIVGKLYRVPNRIIYWHTMIKQLKIDSSASKLSQSFKHWTKKMLLKYCCSLIMTNSKATKEDLLDHYKLKIKIEVFNLLIPDPFKEKEIKSMNKRSFSISFVARMDKSKGHEKVLVEFPEVLSIFPKMRLFLIGSGTDREDLEKKCIELGIQNNVIFTGSVESSKVYDYMMNTLIHVSASEEEAFGLVNIEALATGTPIIANKVGGIREVLVNGYNGLFLKEGRLKDNVQTIIEGWENYSRNARNSFKTYHEVSNTNISKHVDLLQKLLG